MEAYSYQQTVKFYWLRTFSLDLNWIISKISTIHFAYKSKRDEHQELSRIKNYESADSDENLENVFLSHVTNSDHYVIITLLHDSNQIASMDLFTNSKGAEW